jgi:hypothetical protein
MKKLITTLAAVTFMAALGTAAPAQTVKTPEKPGVKTEAPAPSAQVAPKQAAKPGEKATSTKKLVTGKREKSKQEMKQTKKVVKKGQAESKSATFKEKPKPEKK